MLDFYSLWYHICNLLVSETTAATWQSTLIVKNLRISFWIFFKTVEKHLFPLIYLKSWRGYGEKEPLYTAGRDVNWCSFYGGWTDPTHQSYKCIYSLSQQFHSYKIFLAAVICRCAKLYVYKVICWNLVCIFSKSL